MKYYFTATDRKKVYQVNGPHTLTPQTKKGLRLNIVDILEKDLIPFHGALIAKEKGILICGPSGSGKTTLAKQLSKDGYNIITNDFVCVWKENKNLFAGDLNLKETNKNRKKVKLSSIVFLSPSDRRDIFTFSKTQAGSFYKNSFDTKVSSINKFIKTNLFLSILDKHTVLGNRYTPGRWKSSINYINFKQSNNKVGIIGMGTIGNAVANLLLTNNRIKTLSLFTLNTKKIKGLVLDLKSARPDLQIFAEKTSTGVFQKSEIVVISIRNTNTKPLIGFGERMQKLIVHAKIFWELSRVIRTINFSGHIVIVTNPVDVLSWVLYHFSNMNDSFVYDWKGLFSNQVIGVGLGLDHSRLKTLTSNKFELVGEHGKNLLLSKKSPSKCLSYVSNKSLLQKITNYSSQIRKYTDRTVFGPAHETYNVINTLIRETGTLRVSSCQKNGVFLGNIINLKGKTLSENYEHNKKLEMEIEKISRTHRLLYNKILTEMQNKH